MILLCVIFDQAQEDEDAQVLEFDRDHIAITVKNGKVTHKATQRKTAPRLRKRRSQQTIKR